MSAVLLITIDTLPASRVGAYGAPNVRTPVIDSLARSGIQVRDAISPAPITLPSHCTMLTGLDPPRHGVRDNALFSLDDSFETVPELLPEGVRKAAFVGALPVHSRFNLDQGFDLYDDDFGPGLDSRRPPERRARTVFESAEAWLTDPASGDRPFAWVHVFDPHYPYDPPPPWRSAAASLPGAGRFEAEVAYTDRELGRFLQHLDANEPDRRTTILLVSDHGEALGAHGEPTHSLFIYDATQRVPLILAGPGIRPRLESTQRRLVDVAPTLVALYGVDLDVDGEGASLLEPPTVAEAYIETKESEFLRGWSPLHGIRTDRWKYIRAPRPELYDLANDPQEAKNLFGSNPEIETQLSSLVDEILDKARLSAPGVMDPETAEQLASLGYIATIEPGTGADSSKDPKDGIEAAASLFHGIQSFSERNLALARHHLQRAILLDPELKEAHSYLASTYLELGRYDLAADHAAIALELLPHIHEGGAHQTLGAALIALQRPADGLPHLKEAFRMQPQNRDLARLVEEVEAQLR
jgi:arylsulfatase A-like enzyme